MKSIRLCFVAASLSICVLLAGCGGGNQQAASAPEASIAPDMAQLEALLAAELQRLGKDPDKTPSAAPSGATSFAFNPTAYVIDPDGTGPNPPTGVELTWTERVIGDYNQDGLVGVSDLTPLGQRYEESVSYENPDYRFGIAYWPVGHPLDDGGAGAGNPPLAGSGADNWRLARIDGNSDGLIGVSDITAIGQHWAERLDGYRVYRLRPGETEFSWLPNPDNPALAYTVPRSAGFPPGSSSADPGRPVQYGFLDDQLGAATGWYEYYVVAYDAVDNAEGAQSMPVGASLDDGGGGSMPPLAILTSDVELGEVPQVVNYDAAASWDPDGEIVKCEWDMDGDQTTWEYDSTPDTTLQITYNSAGTKHQWVRVTDNDGHTATALAKVSVGDPGGNLPPVARVEGNPPEGEVPLDVTWDAGMSFDHDGSIARYEWDMDQDPTTWEYDSGATPTLDMTYNTGGEHRQYVRVTDDGGLTDTAFGIVYTFGGNQAPTAVITPDKTEGDAPLLVTFDASASSDPDGNVQQYEWDFDGDGTIDSTTGMPTIFTTYTTPGDYQPSVTVTDDLGATDRASTLVTAHGWVTIQVDAGPSLGADVSAAVVNGRPAIAYSMDNMVAAMEMRYIRAEDDYGSLWPASPVVVHDGGSTNRVGYAVSMALVNGRPAIAYEDQTAGKLYYKRADDQDGASWPASPVQADVSANAAGGFCSLAVIDGYPAICEYYVSFGDLMYVRALDQDGTSWSAPYAVHSGVNLGLYSTLLEFTTTTTFPLITHMDAANNQLVFEHATDASGAAWNTPQALCSAGDCVYSASMAIVSGLPAAIYFGLDQHGVPGLNYQRATDTSFNWGTIQQLATGGGNGLRPCIAEIGGHPAVAYKNRVTPTQDDLMYVAATDASGGSWGTIETVDSTNSAGHYLSLIEVGGRPAIAFRSMSSGDLWYAYRY